MQGHPACRLNFRLEKTADLLTGLHCTHNSIFRSKRLHVSRIWPPPVNCANYTKPRRDKLARHGITLRAFAHLTWGYYLFFAPLIGCHYFHDDLAKVALWFLTGVVWRSKNMTGLNRDLWVRQVVPPWGRKKRVLTAAVPLFPPGKKILWRLTTKDPDCSQMCWNGYHIWQKGEGV